MTMNRKQIFGIGLAALVLTVGITATHHVASATDSQPTVRSTTEAGIAGEVIETESGIYYTVKKGDTLWDLSRKFSDSPYLWPDLWSGNPQIANPHRIYPGDKIRLYRREDVEKVPAPVEEKPVTTAAVSPPPSPVVTPSPALGRLAFSKMDRVGFIREPAVSPSGRIFKVVGIHKMITTNDTVYISREGEQSLDIGRRFTVYRTLGKVRNIATDEYLGIQHYMLGIVEITQAEPEYCIGRVVAVYGRIKTGDLLMPYRRRPVQIAKIYPPPGIVGDVIMAEEHNQIIGDNVTAFIDKGDNDGIKTGQVFDVYYQESAKIEPQQKENTLLKPVTFGRLVVLHTEASTATVYITHANQAIRPGSKFSSPEL